MAYKFKQSFYVIKNQDKYLGSKNPDYKSLLEERCCYYMDMNSNVLKWNYERIVIPYINPIEYRILMDKGYSDNEAKKNSLRRYFVDFWFEGIDNKGNTIRVLVEVKPKRQTVPPKQPKRNTQKAKDRYKEEQFLFAINNAKWKAATDYCKKKGWTFVIFTEDDLGVVYSGKK